MMKTPPNKSDVIRMILRLYRASGAEAFFDEPVVHAASASDPWFCRLRDEVVGPQHWLPAEVLRLKHPDAEARSVISWILPVREDIRRENRAETRMTAFRWAAMRSFGEQCNENIRIHLCKLLEQQGFPSIEPHLEQVRRGFDIFGAGLTSRWSERHVAFVAGLGTFGLSGGLITEHGIAHRIGSVVTALSLEPDPRPYGDDPFAWCVKCGVCARRCPGGSIGKTIAEKDKRKCLDWVVSHVAPNRETAYGWFDLSLGCGLCQTGVPCEFRRPGASASVNRG